ncbi:restriction endonuclease subunit S [Paeniclostridium sordellii]|uniref:restriction endonuclease subunit S n=1 Tax=Paraclostridium sordellii TaxID=1505 RepID=UPI00214A0C61|nr:restriction endonuclease subunit S [Paeniclostridium sordellii]MCR1848843.1 restriction endonuclease subunit S [Paeniclostridium sordellii]
MSFNEWKEVVLSDVIQFNPRETIKKGTMSKKIGMDKLDPHTRKINGYEEISYTSGTKFRNGDTLLARITPCLENGKTAQVTILDDNEVAFGSTEFIVMREKLGETINDFIYYLSISEEFRGIAIKSMTGTSGRQRAQKDVIENSTIKLPPIEKQKAIANILSTLDDKIEVNNKINQKLEDIAQAIFKQWFIDFDFPNEEGKPYKSSGGEMVESELGMIPKEWEVKSIAELPVIVTDYVANGSFKSLKDNVTLYEEENYALFMRNTDLKCKFSSDKKFVDEHSYNFLDKSKLFGGEVIISNVGDVGSVYMCPLFDIPMTLGNNVIMINTEKNNTDLNKYLFRLFKSYLGQHLIRSITGGSAQPKFNKTDFRNIKILIPKIYILNMYNEVLKQVENKILKIDIENGKISTLRDTILPKLMSGEIRVPVER